MLQRIQLIIEVKASDTNFEKSTTDESYKICPQCGQSKFPFRYGRCIVCQKQIGDIKYLKSYEKIFPDRDNVKMGIKEVHQGLDEMWVSN